MQENKVPVIDYHKCVHCDKCTDACPNHALLRASQNACSKCVKYCISMEVPCDPNAYIFLYDQCDSCGDCVKACPQKAIYWHDKKLTL